MEFFKVKSFAEAKEIIRQNMPACSGTEKVSVFCASGRRASHDVFAKENLPEYNRSTVDGYAVKATNTYGASEAIPSVLRLIGKVNMGRVGEYSVNYGEAVYVPTGGAVPDGADAMVMIEYTELLGDEVAIYKPANTHDNIMCIGDDIKKGDVILKKGELITSLKTAVLASLGETEIEVSRSIRAAVISTGDELVDINGKFQIGQIRDVNTLINIEFCKNSGFDVVYTDRVKDGFVLLDCAVKKGLECADIVLVSGGSSIGSRDYTERVFASRGEILTHGIALKPGKPTLIAKNDEGKLMFGLPGHPMACLLVLKLLVIDTINEELGGKDEARFVFANTTTNFPSSPGRLTIQPITLECGEEENLVTPLFYKSGFVGIMDKADGYILIPEKTEGVRKGQRVKVFLL